MSERGVAESTQWALLIPALLLVVLGTIQAGVWLHGRTVAADAAGAAAEQVAWARASDAEAAALAGRIAGSGGLQSAEISVTRSAGAVRVSVVARAPMILDLGFGTVREHAVMPLEQVTP